MDISRLLRLVLIVEIIFLLGSALAISRDYQDSWVLEGLEIPFVIFVVTYALAFFSEKRMSWMIALAMIGSFVFVMIPNLKYVWFVGTAPDQHTQYGLANYVYSQGHIVSSVTSGFEYYVSTPFIHLEFAIFSIILNIPVVDSMKYLPVLMSPIYPLLTYSIIKNLKVAGAMKLLKYALFISSIPIFGGYYVVSGSLFGVLLFFLILYTLVVSLQKKDRRYGFLSTFFIPILAVAHSVSSMLFAVFLLAIILLQRVSFFGLKKRLRTQIVFAAAVITAAWLMFQAERALESILNVAFLSVPQGMGPPGTSVPFRFFELARVNILAAMKAVLVLRGADGIILLLTLGGLITLLKMRKKTNDSSRFLFIFTGVLFLFASLGFVVNVGQFRVVNYLRPLFPIFSGLFILHLGGRRTLHLGGRRTLMRVFVFSSIILLATLQLYACQPLIPSASVLSENLPTNEPLVYVTRINSIYQRQMIKFTSEYVNGRIACDGTTAHQILGLTEPDFWTAHVIWWRHYPLDTREPNIEYDFFLIHIPGVSGPFTEQAEMRTGDLILEAIYNSSIVYTNSESYMLIYNSK